MIEKQQRKPKFKVRAYTRCRRCGRPQCGVPQVRAVPHLPARAGARRGDPRRDQGELVRGGDAPMTMTDPIADMLTRIRNANVGDARHGARCRLEAEGVPGRRSSSARGTSRASTSPRPRRARAACSRSSSSTPRTGPARSPASSGSPSPACASTPQADRMPRVLGGMGVAVLSTSQGLMTDREARKRRWAGRSSAMCGERSAWSEGGALMMSRIGRAPIAVPGGRRR